MMTIETFPKRNIKHFSIDGEAVDQEAIIRIRREVESRIIDDMRDSGYVPALDVTPEMFWEYNKDRESFRFVIIVYGSFVGKRRATEILGLLGPNPIYVEPYENKENDTS
jgi:hypothetical protein